VALRPAGPADLAALVALVESAYRGETSRRGWTTEADLLDGRRTDAEAVTELLGRPRSIVVVADAGASLVGCFHLEHRSADAAYFGLFAVAPHRQGAGLGRRLLAEAGRRAQAWGCVRVEMTVIRQREDLIAWYLRLGFRPTGATEPFPYGDERFGRPRRPDLEFLVLSAPAAQVAGLAASRPVAPGRTGPFRDGGPGSAR
jgi:GNAT superfamily N-acetyltransferase